MFPRHRFLSVRQFCARIPICSTPATCLFKISRAAELALLPTSAQIRPDNRARISGCDRSSIIILRVSVSILLSAATTAPLVAASARSFFESIKCSITRFRIYRFGDLTPRFSRPLRTMLNHCSSDNRNRTRAWRLDLFSFFCHRSPIAAISVDLRECARGVDARLHRARRAHRYQRFFVFHARKTLSVFLRTHTASRGT